MGYIVKVSCQTCGYDEEFNLGQGRLDGDLDKVLLHFSEAVSKKIQEYENEDKIITFSFHRDLGFCSTCKRLQVIHKLIVYMKTDETLTFESKCEKCSSDLTLCPTSDTKPEMLCMICEKENLNFEEKGIWD